MRPRLKNSSRRILRCRYKPVCECSVNDSFTNTKNSLANTRKMQVANRNNQHTRTCISESGQLSRVSWRRQVDQSTPSRGSFNHNSIIDALTPLETKDCLVYCQPSTKTTDRPRLKVDLIVKLSNWLFECSACHCLSTRFSGCSTIMAAGKCPQILLSKVCYGSRSQKTGANTSCRWFSLRMVDWPLLHACTTARRT